MAPFRIDRNIANAFTKEDIFLTFRVYKGALSATIGIVADVLYLLCLSCISCTALIPIRCVLCV